ncbi:PAS domain S-box protein [Pedobacter foliorum]|uniref:PAS domain-containing sensor histidine kinase n=1 Tax=Pedobacter foliorum TaxID=2739058 RepID=UPI001567BE4F|nr:PAS domain S-box protein [Pedobacter foliorum]NRF38008.1 PAS domain S-box protein [Pedobacter foliorum]
MDKGISRNGYTEIFNNSPLAQLIINTDSPYYTILEVNKAYLQSTNTKRDALIGKSVFAAFPANPIDHESKNIEQAIFSFNEAIHTKKPHTMSNYRYDIPIPDTTKFEERYWTTANTPILDDDGNVMFLIHSPSNVTELFKLQEREIAGIADQVNARRQLEEAEERTRLALEAVDLGTYDLDLISGEMITSIRFANIFGFDQPVCRADYVKVFHPDDLKIRNKSHKKALKKGILFYEARVLWKDQSVHWVRVEGKVYYNTNGNPYRILGTLLDITEEKKSLAQQLKLKKALADSEHLLKKITSASPACLFMCNENGAITYVNQTWIDWTGLSYDENMVSGWIDAVYIEDRKTSITRFLDTLATHTLHDVEFRINHVDGTLHWCVASGQPQYRTDGSFSGYIGSCTDITLQKELQQQKDAFIGIASHELKTPVTSIKAYTQVMEKMLLKKGEMVEARMMHKMDGQLDRLTSLINDLLDVTKINSGKLQFNAQEFNFELLIRDLIEDLQRTTETHRLIEKYSPTGIVFADKERIGQVVTNLITNAIKYSPNANEIIISTSLKDHEVTVRVEDFGVGISIDDQNKVFEQFYRVKGEMQHTFAGLGLGLYISSEIIKREGGKIWVESTKDKGSTFCFCIPVHKETAIDSIE